MEIGVKISRKTKKKRNAKMQRVKDARSFGKRVLEVTPYHTIDLIGIKLSIFSHVLDPLPDLRSSPEYRFAGLRTGREQDRHLAFSPSPLNSGERG